MRIDRLELLRYGKFTDKTVNLPWSSKDFHLIVGPNEAGKSTLRDAVQDLLFGIQARSRYNFLHHHTDMKLGAIVGQGDETLEFHRIKAQKNTVRTPTDDPLPDNVLIPFIGATDRAFFTQMFGLNHQRLVEGGEQILDASNDLGRILFQAAAGINSLGEIRSQLEQEADGLWGKNRSQKREYYQASDELEQARQDLAQATVRTKDWLEVHRRVEELRKAHEQERNRLKQLEQARIRMERVRRIAPTLAELMDQERQLSELGEMLDLPEDARQLVTQAQQDMAIATHSLTMHEKQIAEVEGRCTDLHPDSRILACAEGIEALARQRSSLVNHERDIGHRELEVAAAWERIQEGARQLGWGECDEAAMLERLPGRLVCADIKAILHRHEAVAQALEAARLALSERQQEREVLLTELAGLPSQELPVSLPPALADARGLGDVAEQKRRLKTQLNRCQRDFENALLELGDGKMSLEALRKLILPSAEEITQRIQSRAILDIQASRLGERLAESVAEIAALSLQIDQYRATHQPVTMVEVREKRADRDITWHAIRNGTLMLDEAASRYEAQVMTADSLSDQCHDKVREAAELQSLQDRFEQRQLQQTDYLSRHEENAKALEAFDQGWADEIAVIGLPDMPLLRVESWRSARSRVLETADAMEEARSHLEDFNQGVAEATQALELALNGIEDEGDDRPPLTQLIQQAEERLEAANTVSERRKFLDQQQARVQSILTEAKQRSDEASKAMDAWQEEFENSLARVHLPLDTHPGTLGIALDLFDDIHKQLERVRDIRVNRIDLMQRDLEAFSRAALALAVDLEPERAHDAAHEISLRLEVRLKQSAAEAKDLERLTQELEALRGKAQEERHRIGAAKASLEHLMQLLPTSSSYEDLLVAIQRSEQHRLLITRRDQALKQLLQDGDGLDRAGLEAEFKSVDLPSLTATLSELIEQSDRVIVEQNRLSGELREVETELGQIAGQDEAAQAESRRQEALARMGIAVERYIRVHTAARLLRWSIDRFREKRQGPMLSRASDIFRGLTQDALMKLGVDHEQNPPSLYGQRPNGTTVTIEGMSEGTRDQLYLALRLAALELHLEQALPLPFIADDLFINYDDGRSRAGFEALAELSQRTQVIFLSHHEHLVPVAREVFGSHLNVVNLN